MTKYGYLGPVGTFTEMALRQITDTQDDLIPYSNVTATLNAVRLGEVEKALVPIENSVEGVVARTLDELAVGEQLVITAETVLPVTFNLYTLPENKGKELTAVATHPHAEAQCRVFIAEKFPKAVFIETSSTAAAAIYLIESKIHSAGVTGAIGAPIIGESYNLETVAENIGENSDAVTRFVVVEKPGRNIAPTGNDRTSIAAFIDIDHAGALLEILQEFAKEEVNLSFIQSRPTGRELGHYHFIIDAHGHISDAPVARSIAAVRKICDDLRLLGSYPATQKRL